jgi:hypothetical protein
LYTTQQDGCPGNALDLLEVSDSNLAGYPEVFVVSSGENGSAEKHVFTVHFTSSGVLIFWRLKFTVPDLRSQASGFRQQNRLYAQLVLRHLVSDNRTDYMPS